MIDGHHVGFARGCGGVGMEVWWGGDGEVVEWGWGVVGLGWGSVMGESSW